MEEYISTKTDRLPGNTRRKRRRCRRALFSLLMSMWLLVVCLLMVWTVAPQSVPITAGAANVDVRADEFRIAATAQITPALEITYTVGADINICAPESSVTAPLGAALHHCLFVRNTGDITLTRHTVTIPALEIAQTFTYTLPPNASMTIGRGSITTPGASAVLGLFDVTGDLVSELTLSSATVDEQTVEAKTSASITVSGDASVLLFKRAGNTPDTCGITAAVSPNTEIYYCFVIANIGDKTLQVHSVEDELLDFFEDFNIAVAPGQRITFTTQILEEQYGLVDALGPYTVTSAITNTIDYMGLTTDGFRVVGKAERAIDLVPVLNQPPTITPTPTPTNTPPPAPTPTHTRSTSTDPTPFPTFTPGPTLSPTPGVLPPTDTPVLELPTPTETATTRLVLAVDTPTPAVTVVPPEVLAVNATATELALQATNAAAQPVQEVAVAPVADLPLPTSTDTVTPLPVEPTATETLIPTPTETPTPTPTDVLAAVALLQTPFDPLRPIETAPPAPTPDAALFLARAVDMGILVMSGLWFACGSILFFGVAGVVAGLYFRQQERSRFQLVRGDAEQRTTARLVRRGASGLEEPNQHLPRRAPSADYSNEFDGGYVGEYPAESDAEITDLYVPPGYDLDIIEIARGDASGLQRGRGRRSSPTSRRQDDQFNDDNWPASLP